MDIPQLAADIAKFLAPFLPYLILASEAAAKEAGKRFGEAAWNKAVALWEKLKPKVEEKPLLKEATEDLKTNQEDEDAQATFRRQLTKLLEADESFAKIIAETVNFENVVNIVGNVEGSTIIVGKDNTLINAQIYVEGNVYNGPAPRNPQDALKVYRAVMANMTANLSLSGIDLRASDPKTQRAIGLANVYIDLNTTMQVEREQVKKSKNKEKADEQEELLRLLERDGQKTQPLSALQALIQNQYLVIKGDPGSGKSTFVNYITHCLATHTTERLENWKPEDADVLPVIVILRDFIKSFKKLPEKAEPKHILDFIEKRLKDQNLSTASKPIQELLNQGKVILFLDGLDEVTSIPQRIFVRDAVHVFVKRHDKNRFVVTCRILSYTEPKEKEPDLRLANFPEFQLAPFNEEQIKNFIGHWYKELINLGSLSKERADELEDNLNFQIDQRPELSKLAENPLLLTVMAVVNTDEGQLPDTRAKLYETVIEKLLWQWELVSKGQETSQLRQLLQEGNLTDADLKPVIWQLAYEAHAETDVNSEDEEALAGIPESKLLHALKILNKGSLDWASKVIEVMKVRAGLLLERENGVFTFPHRSFQEFLAGTYLDSQDNFVDLAKECANNPLLWRQVILWAVSRRVFLRSSLDGALALVEELCPEQIPNDEKAWSKVWLAGDVLLEIGVERAQRKEWGQRLVSRLQKQLVSLIEGNHLSPQERAQAGNTLSKLGDPRFDAEKWNLPKESLYGFVHIPAGEFLMGTKQEDIKGLIEKFGGNEDFYKRETPQHSLHLPDFYMARYPVTVAQFKEFVNDSNYKFENQNSLQGVLNHPVVRVTWFDAIAYCKWLNKKLKDIAHQVEVKDEAGEKFWQGIKSGTLIVTLPSEAEWEKSARGNDARLFSWGDDFDKEKANVEMNIGSTSTVGCFPNGRSFYQLQDTTGNVWEWTRSLWGKDFQKPEYVYPYDKKINERENINAKENTLRVLRGGAFGNFDRLVRCAFRDWLRPLSIGTSSLGFVWWSPIFPNSVLWKLWFSGVSDSLGGCGGRAPHYLKIFWRFYGWNRNAHFYAHV